MSLNANGVNVSQEAFKREFQQIKTRNIAGGMAPNQATAEALLQLRTRVATPMHAPPLQRQNSMTLLPAQGTDGSLWLEDKLLMLRHGSSLQLIAKGTEILNECFESDPEKDFEKWMSRGDDGGMQPYYFLLEDPALDGNDAVKVVLRAVMDGCTAESKPRVLPLRPRIIIDYLFTPEKHRGQGLATLLVLTALNIAQMFGANCYVLAIEESVPYWMGRGFVQEEGDALKARLNIFTDTYLLRLERDIVDPGEPSDIALAIEQDGGDEDNDDGGDDDEEDEDEEKEEEDDEDEQLRRALQASLDPAPVPVSTLSTPPALALISASSIPSSPSGAKPQSVANQPSSGVSEQEKIRAARLARLEQVQGSTRANLESIILPTPPSLSEVKREEDKSAVKAKQKEGDNDDDDDDEAEMLKAIALSLQVESSSSSSSSNPSV